MLKSYSIESLKYLIDLSNGEEPKSITSPSTESDIITTMKYAKQILDLDSDIYYEAMAAIGVEEYCPLNVLKAMIEIKKSTALKVSEVEIDYTSLLILLSAEIPGPAFKMAAYDLALNYILSNNLLNEYKDQAREILVFLQENDTTNNAISAI
jgi:hypothetical protein